MDQWPRHGWFGSMSTRIKYAKYNRLNTTVQKRRDKLAGTDRYVARPCGPARANITWLRKTVSKVLLPATCLTSDSSESLSEPLAGGNMKISADVNERLFKLSIMFIQWRWNDPIFWSVKTTDIHCQYSRMSHTWQKIRGINSTILHCISAKM